MRGLRGNEEASGGGRAGGYAILTLLLFRLARGFVGPRHARFASFPPSPAAAWRYLRASRTRPAGHSPLGALSVYAMLASLALQVGTGFFSNDAIMWDGPLRPLVTNDTSDWLRPGAPAPPPSRRSPRA